MQLLYSRSSSHQKRHRYCCAIFIYWISQEKNIFFLPLLLSASTVGFHQPSQCLKNISKWSLKDSRNCFENPHQEEPLNITQHFSTLFVLLGLLLLPLALSPHSACALFLLCKKKKTLKRGSVDPKPPKTDIVYISDSQQLIVWDKCVCVFYYWYNNIISQLHSSQSRQFFYLNISVSQQKNWRKKNIWLSSASSFYEVCEYFCCYLWSRGKVDWQLLLL